MLGNYLWGFPIGITTLVLNVLVKISTDEGLWGIGEAAPFEPVTGASAATVLEALKLFRTGLIGMDPLDVEGIHRMMDRLLSGNTSAKAAVDIALYDICLLYTSAVQLVLILRLDGQHGQAQLLHLGDGILQLGGHDDKVGGQRSACLLYTSRCV